VTLELLQVNRAPVYHEPWDEGFSQRLYRARKNRYRSREAAERGTGISAKSWERWETGEKVPNTPSLRLVCEKLKVNPCWLLWGADVPEFEEVR
jgi:transcriptional regulator with XRE-family HTH domain